MAPPHTPPTTLVIAAPCLAITGEEKYRSRVELKVVSCRLLFAWLVLVMKRLPPPSNAASPRGPAPAGARPERVVG